MNASLKLISIGLLSLLFSCTSTETNRLSAPVSAPKVSSVPLDANVSVDSTRRITGTSRALMLFGFIQLEGDHKYLQNARYSEDVFAKFNPLKSLSVEEKVKSAAMYNAVIPNNADVIVAPRFTIEKTNNIFVTKYKVTVSGYKGKINSFTKSKK